MPSFPRFPQTSGNLWLLLLTATVTAGFIVNDRAGVPARASNLVDSKTTIDGTAVWAKTVGYLSYADRSTDVQDVMQRMYDNDSRYHTLSALFVNREPGIGPGSLRLAIHQPDLVRTDVFANVAGSGVPSEQMRGQGGQIQLNNPARGVTTTVPRLTGQRLPPLASVPLTVEQAIYSGTTIHGNPGNATVSLADSFVHPASFVTDPIFCAMRVSVVADGTLGGRHVWVLRGDKVPSTPPLGRLGDGWRLWVDRQTGIILRLEYYSGVNMIGWAEMRDVTVDEIGSDSGGPASVSIPSHLKQVTPLVYQQLLPHVALSRPLQTVRPSRRSGDQP